jgi:hypothetical protein
MFYLKKHVNVNAAITLFYAIIEKVHRNVLLNIENHYRKITDYS